MEDQKGLSLDNTLLLFILINGENQLECSPLGTVEKVFLECESLLSRFLSWFGNRISRTNWVREFQFPHEQEGFSTVPLGEPDKSLSSSRETGQAKA
jgi:hypothetical protein